MMQMDFLKVISRKTIFFNFFFVGLFKVNEENSRIRITSGSGSISQRHGSVDPDPDLHQNVMDPQHWLLGLDSGVIVY